MKGAPKEGYRMEHQEEEPREVDALCKECGHGFKVYVDRMIGRSGAEPGPDKKAECPVCGCGDCRIGR
jgi:hypothetical protein